MQHDSKLHAAAHRNDDDMRFSLKEEEAETSIYQRLPVSTHKQIVEFMNKHNYRSRNEAINDLINVALIVCDNLHKIEDDDFVAEIKAQMQEGGLVDYVSKLNPKEFDILWSIIRTELKVRKIDILKNEALL